MITVQCERIADIVEELKPLVAEHFDEIARYKDIPLDIDWDFYRTNSHMRCYAVREDGALIGYGVYGVARNKHYRSSLQAVQDVLFVHPAHRGSAGYRLIRFVRNSLMAEGVQVVYDHVKKSHPLLGRILKSMGSEEVESIWATRLDKEKSWA